MSTGAGAGLAVTALVVEHHSDLITPAGRQGRALKVKRSHPQAEPVGEHHGQWCGDRTDLAHHQRDAVGRGDHASTIGLKKTEILTLVSIFDIGPVPKRSRSRHPGDSTDRAQSRHPGQQPRLLADTETRLVGLAGQPLGALGGSARQPFVDPALGVGLVLTGHGGRPPDRSAPPAHAGW